MWINKWGNVILWTEIFLGGVGLLILMWHGCRNLVKLSDRSKRRERFKENHCTQCEYDLAHLEWGWDKPKRCPECGLLVSDMLLQIERDRVEEDEEMRVIT